MNHRLDQLLTCSALSGWVASMAALLTIGLSSSPRPVPLTAYLALNAPRSPQSAETARAETAAFLGLTGAGFDPNIRAQAPLGLPLAAPHWLSRSIPANLPDRADVGVIEQSLWLSHTN